MMGRTWKMMSALFLYLNVWMKWCYHHIAGLTWIRSSEVLDHSSVSIRTETDGETETWKTDQEARTYRSYGGGLMFAIQTSTHLFYADLETLADRSEYFEALWNSRMRERTEHRVNLSHIPSSVFHNLLQFVFRQSYSVPDVLLEEHLRASVYLLVPDFTRRLLTAISSVLTSNTCPRYLRLAEELCSRELQETVLVYLSTNLLELPHLNTGLDVHLQQEVRRLRSRGPARLCCLRKENLVSRDHGGLESVRKLFRLEEDDGAWSSVADLPFVADKWCFTTAVLFNYLYLIGGFRHKVKKGYEFKMASFRYNPLKDDWVSTAPLIKHRRHFSAAVCEGHIYALGGWYLDSLVTPDSSTGVYTAVERYDPWTDSWAFVSSLPLTDFQFTLSLSHDAPLTTSLGSCVYVLGNVQRTGEKLILRYDTEHDCWSELLPTLTRTDANMPSLHFLGSTDVLIAIGGNNMETVVASFCLQARRWRDIRRTQKTALVGQGTVFNNAVFMPGNRGGEIFRLDLDSLSVFSLPPLPIATGYESCFHLSY